MIPNDTSREAEEFLLELIRNMTPAKRAAMMVRRSTQLIRASKRAIARVHPEFSEEEVRHCYIELHYGKELADEVRRHVRTLKDA